MDQVELHRRWWGKVFGAPSVWLSAAAGISAYALLGGLTGTILATAGLSIAAASVAWKLTWGRAEVTEKVLGELRDKERRGHFASLRELQRRLRKDGDARTGQQLRALRELCKRMQRIGLWDADPHEFSATRDVKRQIRQLYESTLASLERTLELHLAAREMADEVKRRELQATRARIIEEIEGSVRQLGKTLDQLQAVQLMADASELQLSQARDELDAGLEVARNVQRRMDELEQSLRPRETEF